MKKILIGSLVAMAFTATSAFACGTCGCAAKTKDASSEKVSCCPTVDGKKVLCEKCKAKKADAVDVNHPKDGHTH